MTLPKNGARGRMAAYLDAAREGLVKAGLDVPEISTGGSPDMW
jgi:hypothetical protein